MNSVKVTFVENKCLMSIQIIGKLQVLKKISISLIFSLVVLATGYSASSEAIPEQQKIVAELSGHEANSSLTSRDTPKLRKLAAEYLMQHFRKRNASPSLHKYRYKNANGIIDLLLPPYKGQNVYNILPAKTGSQAYVIIGAHYDSDVDAPGAGDNAAGVAVVLELFKRMQLVKERNINFIFVLLDQEEDDEVGSKAFIKFIESEKLDIHSVHITDIPGWDIEQDRIIEIQSPAPYLEHLYRAGASKLGFNLKITTGASSDNKAFLEKGYKTVGVFGDVTEHLHKSTDTFENVDFEYLAILTELMYEALIQLNLEMENEK